LLVLQVNRLLLTSAYVRRSAPTTAKIALVISQLWR
jgi:hypothetical protein